MDMNYTLNFKDGHSRNMFGKGLMVRPDFIQVNGLKVARTKDVDYVEIANKWEYYRVDCHK